MARRHTHSIDTVFVVLIFLIFTMAGVLALILGVNFYNHTVNRAEDNASLRAAVGYVREMIRQNDGSEISITNFEGLNAISIQKENDVVLYIYAMDGNLKELYTKNGSSISAKNGEDIMPIASAAFEIDEDGMMKAYLVDDGNHMETLYFYQKGGTR